jgi:hypothetical protein
MFNTITVVKHEKPTSIIEMIKYKPENGSWKIFYSEKRDVVMINI